MSSSFLPIQIKLKSIKSIRCGTDHCLALTKDYKVYGWGSGESGELGNGAFIDQCAPLRVDFSKYHCKIVKIYTGAAHSMFVSSDKLGYSCGDNKYFQTGVIWFNEDRKVGLPRPVMLLKNIKKFSCGDAHSIALTFDGEVFGWGYGEQGQIGSFKENNGIYLERPTKISFSEKVKNIYAGSLQSFFMLSDSSILGCGSNDQNQLGFESEEESIKIPTKLTFLENKTILKFRTGCSHSLCLIQSGEKGESIAFYGWGMNRHGQLGNDLPVKTLPSQIMSIPGDDVEDFGVGGYHTAILMK